MLSRRTFLSTLAATPLLRAQKQPPLNFVFILIDDMGWRDVGYNGSELFETPNIDKLAMQGMRFTNAYAACPVCSPTRASIMTGKYPARLGLTNFLPGLHHLPHSKLLAPVSRQQLPLEEVTIAEALKPSGYRTAAIGKWHLGGPDFFPEKQGFDVNVGGTQAGSPKSYFFPQWQPNPPITAQPGAYLPDRLTDSAIDFIKDNRAKPFLVYLAHYSVHIPLEAKEDMVERYRKRIKPGDLQNNATYAAMVASVDESVGRLLETLDELKIADHTAVIFMSDNGGLASAEYKGQTPTSNKPLKAGKGFLYEGGIREPMIVKWPGVTKAGSQCDVPVISTDFYPTMLEMAGVTKDPGKSGGWRQYCAAAQADRDPQTGCALLALSALQQPGRSSRRGHAAGGFQNHRMVRRRFRRALQSARRYRRGAQSGGADADESTRDEGAPGCLAEGTESGDAQAEPGLR